MNQPKTSPLTQLGPAFVSARGELRSGWRLLIFLLLFYFLSAASLGMLRLLTATSDGNAGVITPAVVIWPRAAEILAIVVATLVMARIEVRHLADYGIAFRRLSWRRFVEGIAWGSASLTLLMVALGLHHNFNVGTLAVGRAGFLEYGIVWAIGFLMVAVHEEFLLRGYPLFTLTTGLRFWPAAIILSAGFGYLHLRNAGENWIGAMGAALIGLFFCLTVKRTGSVWWAVGFHGMWDYAQSFIYSVPDSGIMVPGHLLNSSMHGPSLLTGGEVGPEASILIFPLIAALFVAFPAVYKGRDIQYAAVEKSGAASN